MVKRKSLTLNLEFDPKKTKYMEILYAKMQSKDKEEEYKSESSENESSENDEDLKND